ncbi:hypothetical protein OIU77_010500 [Salix suchowensis]|uniref:Ribosomal protein L20 n=1 Tax=Salix suchowensis TaxID=1278906 RepID=A0ABQ9A8J4_9ROSI|nr:hypothetical protein OIU77_010500 [Salix suchowensis]
MFTAPNVGNCWVGSIGKLMKNRRGTRKEKSFLKIARLSRKTGSRCVVTASHRVLPINYLVALRMFISYTNINSIYWTHLSKWALPRPHVMKNIVINEYFPCDLRVLTVQILH